MLSQTAGMLAYLLSIYPSATFDPELTSKKSLLPLSLLETAVQAYPAFASLQRVYSIAHAALPDTVAKFLPAPKDVFAVAPITGPGFPTLSPKELKQALLDLASEDMLTMIPADTPNLLIFNNATTPK
jgi:cerevisin